MTYQEALKNLLDYAKRMKPTKKSFTWGDLFELSSKGYHPNFEEEFNIIVETWADEFVQKYVNSKVT